MWVSLHWKAVRVVLQILSGGFAKDLYLCKHLLPVQLHQLVRIRRSLLVHQRMIRNRIIEWINQCLGRSYRSFRRLCVSRRNVVFSLIIWTLVDSINYGQCLCKNRSCWSGSDRSDIVQYTTLDKWLHLSFVCIYLLPTLTMAGMVNRIEVSFSLGRYIYDQR